jgi:hypothetical protein
MAEMAEILRSKESGIALQRHTLKERTPHSAPFRSENQGIAEIKQKQEKPSRQYVSDLQSSQDERYTFSLISKLTDKISTSHLCLFRDITYFVSKTPAFQA